MRSGIVENKLLRAGGRNELTEFLHNGHSFNSPNKCTKCTRSIALPFETVHVLLHSLSYNFASLTLSKYTAQKQEYTCKRRYASQTLTFNVHVQIFQHG